MQISDSKVSRFLQTLAVEDAGILCKLALSKLTHSLFNVYHVVDFKPGECLPASRYSIPAWGHPQVVSR